MTYLLIFEVIMVLVLTQPSSLSYDVTHSQYTAMKWIKVHTKIHDTFLVITPNLYQQWPTDSLSEWFPTITERKNVPTIQGTEWLSDNAFHKRVLLQYELYRCRYETITCFEKIKEVQQAGVKFIFIPQIGNDTHTFSLLKSSLRKSSHYKLRYSHREELWEKI